MQSSKTSDNAKADGENMPSVTKVKGAPAAQEARRESSVAKDDCQNVEGMKHWMLVSILLQHLHLSN